MGDVIHAENSISHRLAFFAFGMLLCALVAIPVLVVVAATIIDETSKEWIAMVVDDMCDYTMSSGTESVQHEDGTETSQSILYVNVILYDYRDMIAFYGFDEAQTKILETLMTLDSLAVFGNPGGEGAG